MKNNKNNFEDMPDDNVDLLNFTWIEETMYFQGYFIFCDWFCHNLHTSL